MSNFENLRKVHDEVEEKDNVVRLSIDSKDKVKIGELSRDGKSRVRRKSLDHDFGNESITPFGIMDIKADTVDIYLAESNVAKS